MNDLEQRVKALEIKVKLLEETLEKLKNTQIPGQVEGGTQPQIKPFKCVDFATDVSDQSELDFSQEESLKAIKSQKESIDSMISAAIKKSETFSDQYPDDPRYFNYEMENGTEKDWGSQSHNVAQLASFVGKGIRITSYNGFETKRVIIPKEIDGYPVISIGEKAFMNAPIEQLILPNSLKAIMAQSFSGCQSLTHLDLPDGLLYMGEGCFENTGLLSINIPNAMSEYKMEANI